MSTHIVKVMQYNGMAVTIPEESEEDEVEVANDWGKRFLDDPLLRGVAIGEGDTPLIMYSRDTGLDFGCLVVVHVDDMALEHTLT